MSNRKRVFILILIMASSALIETVARFDSASAKSDGLQSARSATLIKIIEAHMNYDQSGRIMAFTLAERKDDAIIFFH
jgi:hypothetical protein